MTINRGVGAALGAAVLFGLSTPLAKLLLTDISPLLLAGLLYTGSGLGLAFILAIRAMSNRSSIVWPRGLLRRAPPLGIFLMGAMVSQADSMRPPTSTPTAIEGSNTMPFESVNIGHRKLSYLCRGTGSPTVIAEGGPGFSFSEMLTRPKPIRWQIAFLQVTSKTRMCVYGRAHVGKSDLRIDVRFFV